MEKGHIELGEVFFVALLIVGLAAAVLIFTGSAPPPAQAPQNATGAVPEPLAGEGTTAGATAAPGGTSAAEQPEQEPSGRAVTNATVGSILEAHLSQADSRFYSAMESGQYDVSTYQWAMGKMNDSPDAIPLKQNDLRALDVRFNDRYVDSLRAFAYRVYSVPSNSKPPVIYGVALFISASNPLEGLNSTIDVRYDPHPEGTQILESCKVLSESESETPGGTILKVYDMECRIMYGASP